MELPEWITTYALQSVQCFEQLIHRQLENLRNKYLSF